MRDHEMFWHVMFYAMSCNVMSCCLMLCMYEDMCGCINTSLSLLICVYMCIYICVYIYDTYVCIYVCIYIYTQFNVCFCSSVSCSLPLPPSKCRHAYTHTPKAADLGRFPKSAQTHSRTAGARAGSLLGQQFAHTLSRNVQADVFDLLLLCRCFRIIGIPCSRPNCFYRRRHGLENHQIGFPNVSIHSFTVLKTPEMPRGCVQQRRRYRWQ